MKATDLMIGDWVKISYNGEIGQVYRIDMANGNGNEYAAVNGGDRSCEDLVPIPLTPEILEKNGYVHDKLAEQALIAGGATRDTCVLISSDHRNMINNASHNINSHNKWFVHVDTEDMCSMAGFEITYVHELQHALKLCGIEKEITL